MTIDDIFTEGGEFKVDRYYDPYRLDEEDREYHSKVFDSEGNVRSDVMELIEERLVENPYRYSVFSDIVCCYHAHQHGLNTHRSYPAVYYWR